MDLPRYWAILRRAAWWILPAAALVMLGTWLYARQLPKVYVATARIMAPQRSGGQLGDGRGDSLLGLAAAAIGSQSVGTPALYLAYLDSRAMAQGVVDNLHAIDRLSVIQATQGTEFRLNKSGALIEVRVEAHNPQLAAAVANAYPVQLDRMLRATLSTEASRQRRFLEAQLVQADRTLRTIRPYARAGDDLTPQGALVQALSIQVEQARIAEARDLPTVQVLDRATPPTSPVGPPVRRIVQYAGALALVVLSLAAVGWDGIHRRRPTPPPADRELLV